MTDLSRRRLFGLFAAPAIVRATSLMPVSLWRAPGIVYLSQHHKEAIDQKVRLLFRDSIADPDSSAFLRTFLCAIASLEIYCDPSRSTKRDGLIAEDILNNNWVRAARLSGLSL